MNCNCNLDKKALLELADKLEKVPDENFDMNDWFMVDNDSLEYSKLEPEDIHALKNHECGMTACLGGWAALLFPNRFSGHEWQPLLINFKKAFGLCLDHAKYLTERDAPHQTPKQAAKAIRKLVGE